ncbi:MAG: CBS domain-containing protein, partial [Pseudomonadota bacterium]
LIVPDSMPLSTLLVKMQATRIHLAIVVDEYGGTDGLVSLEDLVEEIVGEIEDEHDEDTPMLTKRGPAVWEADARMEIEDFASETGIDLELADFEDDIDQECLKGGVNRGKPIEMCEGLGQADEANTDQKTNEQEGAVQIGWRTDILDLVRVLPEIRDILLAHLSGRPEEQPPKQGSTLLPDLFAHRRPAPRRVTVLSPQTNLKRLGRRPPGPRARFRT